MKRSAILVLGDPGPVRNDLLMRADLELLWMSALEDALALLQAEHIHLVLIGPELAAESARRLLLAARGKQVACVMLVDAKRSAPIAPSTAAHAAAVIPIGQVESVLALVGFHTGLPFSRDPRATIEAPVRVMVDHDTYELETANLSVSGVAIDGLPMIASGTPVRLELDLPFGPVFARARVVRWARDGNKTIAGLAFTELSMIDRERISKLVESARREAPASQLRVSDLFDDIIFEADTQDALATGDLDDSSDLPRSEQLLDVREELEMLERWSKTGRFPPDVPEWLPSLASELTDLEHHALAKRAVPTWVLPALMVRLALARSRHVCGLLRLPSVVSAKSYRTFVELADVAAGLPPSIVTQIAKMRAALLRDLLCTHRLIRAGTVAGVRGERREGVQHAMTR